MGVPDWTEGDVFLMQWGLTPNFRGSPLPGVVACNTVFPTIQQ